MQTTATSIAYGSHSEQHYEWYEPLAEVPPKGVIVLVHGGFWRQPHTLVQMHPLTDFFLEQGWAVANLEYRRGNCGGDWPHILEDVLQGFQSVRQQMQQRQLRGPLVGIGHSVGGQLVLLAAQEQDYVIALAPVTDVSRTAQEDLGESAAQAFFGARLDEVARAASPIHQLPSQRPILVVHGEDDQRVPLQHSIDYIQALKEQNPKAEFWSIPNLDHFYIIDPHCDIWPKVLGYLDHTI